jgi:uncharacterized protein (DUF1697 family)
VTKADQGPARGTTYVALLRGINVGRAKQVAMADLRNLLTGLGYTGVRTLLRSGNAILTGPDRPTAAVAAEIEKAIADRLGLDVRCVVRTAAELRAVVDANELRDVVDDGARLLVTFLATPLDRALIADLDPATYEPERFHIADREIYVWYANGILDSKLSHASLEKRLRQVATARNWNTITKLLAMAEEA